MSYKKVYFILGLVDACAAMEVTWGDQDNRGDERTPFSCTAIGKESAVSANSQEGENDYRRALDKMNIEYTESDKSQFD